MRRKRPEVVPEIIDAVRRGQVPLCEQSIRTALAQQGHDVESVIVTTQDPDVGIDFVIVVDNETHLVSPRRSSPKPLERHLEDHVAYWNHPCA